MEKFKMIGKKSATTLNFSSGSEDGLQRTEDWLEARKGCFTGSKLKNLMSCGRSTSKMPWGSPEKLVDFGAASERYIYNVGMERLTGTRSQEKSSKEMDWGKENEPFLIQQLIDDGVITDFEELGFEQFYENGGASADGCATYVKTGERIAMELKCCVSWDGHYNRMYEPVHDKHDDFWQFQGEMMATGMGKVMYVVTHPMTTKVYDYNFVSASKLHQKELLNRCKIADHAISLWGGNLTYKECLEVACANFKEKIN